MPSNSLVPVARIDKNGRTVTRHMRPENTVGAATNSIPVVSLPARADTSAIQKLSTELYEVHKEFSEDYEDYCNVDIEIVLTRLENCSPHVIDAYWGAIQRGECIGLSDLFFSALNNGDSDEKLGHLFLAIEHYVQVDTRWVQESKGTQGYRELLSTYQGLMEHSSILNLPDDILTASEDEQDRFRALMGVVTDLECLQDERFAIYRDGEPTKVLDRDVLLLVSERWQDFGSIQEIIEERQTADVDVIKAVLDADVSALREGSL